MLTLNLHLLDRREAVGLADVRAAPACGPIVDQALDARAVDDIERIERAAARSS
jgi:hypothetical protein